MVLLSAGHGGYDGKKYHCLLGGKSFKHSDEGYHFDSGTFYEGVWNRYMMELVKKYLFILDIPYIQISDDLLDLTLSQRVEKVNYWYSIFPDAFLIDLHANASRSHEARGYEVYTSPGWTPSDILATYHYRETEERLGGKIKFRSDKWSDGDPDKEAEFTVLTRTHCPAILVEHLFFDEPNDAKLLMEPRTCMLFAEATAHAALRFMNDL